MAKIYMITEALKEQEKLNPLVYEAVTYFKNDCIQQLKEKFSKISFMSPNKTWDLRIADKRFPEGHFLMSLWPYGKVAWGKQGQLQKLYGERSKEIGQLIHKEKINMVDSKEVANQMAELLTRLIQSIDT